MREAGGGNGGLRWQAMEVGDGGEREINLKGWVWAGVLGQRKEKKGNGLTGVLGLLLGLIIIIRVRLV